MKYKPLRKVSGILLVFDTIKQRFFSFLLYVKLNVKRYCGELTSMSFPSRPVLVPLCHRRCVTLHSIIFHVSFGKHRGNVHSTKFLKLQELITITNP